MGASINFVCPITKAIETINFLEEEMKIDLKLHTTIKMGISYCREIFSRNSNPNPDQKLAALEFLGAAYALCGAKQLCKNTEFKYSNNCQGIFWRLEKDWPFQFRRISARLWDFAVDEARAARIEFLTCHNNNYTHHKRGDSTFDHYERIEQEIERITNIYNDNGGPLAVSFWISAQSVIEVEPINEDPAWINYLYDVNPESDHFHELDDLLFIPEIFKAEKFAAMCAPGKSSYTNRTEVEEIPRT